MTTFTSVGTASLAVGKPFTSATALAFRDNPIAIAECDPSVALSLLPTVLLGTLTTTSGAAQTLSGLTLTPYKFVRLVFNGVSISTAANFYVSVVAVASVALVSSVELIYGFCDIDLSNGVGVILSSFSTTQKVAGGATGYSTATTSITVTATAGTFDAGSIKIYGVK